MELSNKQMSEIRDILVSIKKREFNIHDLYDIRDILRESEIRIFIQKFGVSAITDYLTKDIYFNFEKMMEEAKAESVSTFGACDEGYTFLDFYNRNMFKYVLHEIMHIKQLDGISISGVDEYYRDIINYFKNDFNYMGYNRNWDNLSIEHHADAESSRIMLDLYDIPEYNKFRDYLIYEYAFYMLNGYKKRMLGKVDSVFDRTLKIIKSKKEYDFSSLDLKSRLLYGLPVSSKELDSMRDVYQSEDLILRKLY